MAAVPRPSLALIAALALAATPVAAATQASGLCDAAASRASAETGVPEPVLLALTRTETGRPRDGALAPWPWTVNLEGAGRWFDTPDEALEFAYDALRTGRRSFDVGCFQINFRWHGTEFPSLEVMFDPLANARYAARFLTELYDEFGDWSRAAGAFHSRNDEFAERYRDRYERILAGLDGPSTPARDWLGGARPLVDATPGQNLIIAALSRPSAGSLFPLLVAVE